MAIPEAEATGHYRFIKYRHPRMPASHWNLPDGQFTLLGLNGNWGVVPPTAAMFRSPVVELKYVPNDRSKLYATAGSDPEPP